jgi:hypothetical protein
MAVDIPSVAGVVLANPIVYEPTQKPTATASNEPPTSIQSTSSTYTSSSTSSTAATQTASLYLVTTKNGTSMSDFTSFIQTFPDGGKGQQIAYSHVNIQSYITSINSSYAATVAQNSIVDTVVVDTPLSEASFGVNAHTNTSILPHVTLAPEELSGRFRKRAAPSPPSENLVRQPNSQSPLQIISQGITNNVRKVTQDYLFDPIAGAGITIYVLDSGFLQGATVSGFTSMLTYPHQTAYLIVDRTSTSTRQIW